jgi:[acyl-carrier-protein] S-malonyltransferase
MNFAFMFPGQGSQSVGMGKDLAAVFPAAHKRFEDADKILGRSLTKIIFEGPEDQLKATENTQPALFTIQAALNDILAEKGIRPSFAMGHSLGEYGALYSAGVLSFEDGLKLVARRGELMAMAGKSSPGTMAAIVGLEKTKIADVLKTVGSGIVVCANENSPDQTVISGEIPAVNEACEKLKAAGAKRAVPLPVSGAFHSPLMKPAADEFEKALAPIAFRNPICPIIANVTATGEIDAAVLKSLLVRQLTSPVRWVDSIRHLAFSAGALRCAEVGPGNVLQGLARKIESGINVIPCGKVENVYSFVG